MGVVVADFKGTRTGIRAQIKLMQARLELAQLRNFINEADYGVLDLASGNNVEEIDEVSADLGDLIERIRDVIPGNVLVDPRAYSQLRGLLAWRVKTVNEIGVLKRANGLGTYDGDREREHTQDLIRRYPQQEALINSLFPIIYSYCRERQDGNQGDS